ncbi:MAG: cation acetate symporter [Pirellulaceae bacterium]|nr:cation acetate symporter [Pirellulaceae bacterium]
MNTSPSGLAVTIFVCFLAFTLGLSFYLGRKAKDSSGYFAAHGQIPWFVNGVAFAGDYLSAASFLGICGMIAFYGYDGFLYSIGYLAGWIVALLVIAEPLKRLGKFTFADALNARFQSKGIQLAAGISTLAVSVFYLIPQMVGAGVLVQPLLGFPHWVGVVLVGAVVILIVVTAGMVSTTWVQFIKGALLIVFSCVLTVMILQRGLVVRSGGTDGYQFTAISLGAVDINNQHEVADKVQQSGYRCHDDMLARAWRQHGFWLVTPPESTSSMLCRLASSSRGTCLMECQSQPSIHSFLDSTPPSEADRRSTPGTSLRPVGYVSRLPHEQTQTGSLGPWEYLQTISGSEVVLWSKTTLQDLNGKSIEVFFPKPTSGAQITRPGEHPMFAGIRQPGLWPKLNFLSLMAALFCGTASLPHILIRYYTVKDGAAARKSTIVGIGTIGAFYILTLFMGLGAMTSGALDVTNENMSAPLLARSISEWLFAVISAIAFTTVLGTVSGLILASAGAVSHDLLKTAMGVSMNDRQQVRIAKIASVVVGIVAIALGILFGTMNVTYLVGWAFSVAASANLPALVMLLFWRRTSKQGVIAAVLVGMTSSLGWILLSADTFDKVYHAARPAWIVSLIPFSQPGIVTIPLAFATLIVVSLLTSPRAGRLPL